MMSDFWLGEATKWMLLLTLAGNLWNPPFVSSETCNSKIRIRPVVDISSSPENVSLAVGASITLTCKAEPRAIDRGYLDRWVKYIQWYNPNGTEVGAKCQQPSNIFAYKRKFSCPLVFKNLTEDEFGHYICQAGNGYNKHCTRQSFAIGSAPVFLEVPRNQSVYIDSNVTFDCNATGLPKPSISWIKNDDFHTLQSNSSTKDKKSIHSELSITKVKKEDFGGYKCVAINSVGKKVSLSAFLSLKEKREDPKTQSNSVDSNGIFSLTATCHFKPNKSNDSNVSKTNSMVKFIATSDATKCHSILSIKLINESTNEDGGTYQCRTSGKGKSKLASLHAKEEITETRLQESSTTQIAIAIAASCVVATLLINSILGLLWYKRFKGGKKSEGQRNVVRVHMNNGRYPTVVIAQDAEELLSL
ncbi:contactin-3-like [Pocillopora verrucosa]|uniref:contactin-3-like n=1 Tax=Pocillopora verrucosa TaxID=203993 RepID=UPI003342BD4D